MKNKETGASLLIKELDRAMTLLVDTCENTAKSSGQKTIPVGIIRMYKDTLISNYKEGLKENPNMESK